jgi:hypothetical protein
MIMQPTETPDHILSDVAKDKAAKVKQKAQADPIKLLDCPCGAKAHEVDWTGSTTYGTGTYQTCWVTCTRCDIDVSINVNTDHAFDCQRYERMVSEVWNKLTRDTKADDNEQ